MATLITDYNNGRILAGDTTAAGYTLLAVLGTDGLSYVVKNPQGNLCALKAWSCTPGEIESVFHQMSASDPYLSHPAIPKRITFFSPEVTLVPRRMYQPGNGEYFGLLSQSSETSSTQVIGTEWSAMDCYCLVRLPNLLTVLGRRFSADLTAQDAQPYVLLQAWQRLASIANERRVFVHLRYSYLQVGVFENGKLLFFNTFEFQKSNDVLYFVLLAYQKTQCSADVPLYLSGNLLKDSEIYKTLMRFIRHLRFAPSPTPSEGDSLFPAHLCFDLLSRLV